MRTRDFFGSGDSNLGLGAGKLTHDQTRGEGRIATNDGAAKSALIQRSGQDSHTSSATSRIGLVSGMIGRHSR